MEHAGGGVPIWHGESKLVLLVPQALQGAASKAGVTEPHADKYTLEHCGPEVPFSRPLSFTCALSHTIDLKEARKITTIFPF